MTTSATENEQTAQATATASEPRATTKANVAPGWQRHSLRGFLSGSVGKKMGLAVTSTKGEDGERSYSVKG